MERTIEKEEIENIVENTEEIKEKKQKKKFTIMGISIWRLLAYFIIYSVVGFIIETLFGLVTKGVIESRKSFLYGPFCSIYGLGAVIMIPLLQKFKKNNYTLFFGGVLIGSIVEYLISLIGEVIFHIKWWDYSDMAFNIQGRICIAFSFFWGILAIYLISHFNPIIDRFIERIKEKIPIKVLKALCISIIIFLFIDFLITSFALKMFFTRIVAEHNIKLQAYDEYIFECVELYKNEDIKKFTLTYFSDEKMLKTFPNIKLTGEDGKVIWVCDILKDIQPYHLRIFTPAHSK